MSFMFLCADPSPLATIFWMNPITGTDVSTRCLPPSRHLPAAIATRVHLLYQPARPAALPDLRPQLGDGGHRAVERGLATKALHGPAATPLQYLAPLGWEHIDLMGDYVCPSSAKLARRRSGRYGRCNRLRVG